MDSSLNQQIYDRLKNDILTFALKPGEPVSAQKLALRYDVSRTPAREALVRLQDEELVEIYPQSRSLIARIKSSKIREEWYIRRSLELGLVDLFFDRLKPEHIERMKNCAKWMENLAGRERTPENSYEYLLSDDSFHQTAFEAAGQNLAFRLTAGMLPNYRRARILIDMDRENEDRTLAGHRKLISYLEKKDREGYRAFLEEHISNIKGDVLVMRERFPEMFEEEN